MDMQEILNPGLMTRLRKVAIAILSDRRTAALAPTIQMGEMLIDDSVPTACTDGRNTYFGTAFCEPLSFKQLVYLVLHEELHKLTMDLLLYADLFALDALTANVACDHGNNIVIETSGINDMIERPPGALVNMKFKGWSKPEIFHFLRTGRDKDGKQSTPQFNFSPGDSQQDPSASTPQPVSVTIDGETFSLRPMDTLDKVPDSGLPPEEMESLKDDISRAIQQAIIMAGIQGQRVSHTIMEAVAPKVDWRAIMSEFMQSMLRGEDELSYRRFDRRYIDLAPGNELYLPTTINERLGTVLVCMDASGSTYGAVFNEFVAAFQSILTTTRPERLRVLHWDTEVKHDQTLVESEYLDEDLKTVLKPVGGGGTAISSVSDYILANSVTADCCVVFTDGYIEDAPRWQPRIPTLWMVTRKKEFTPPAGKMVRISN
jgi:hypothetical protein